MNRPHFVVILLAGLFLVQFGCDTGLQPLNELSGFSGVIRFKNWPRPDSVAELRLVAFSSYPSDSSAIYVALFTGRAVVYPPIGTTGFPKFVDSIRYTWTTQGTTLQLAKYDYIVLAQRYGLNSFTDWQPAGVYTTQPHSFEPAPVRVLLHRMLQNVDIDVDFQNPPPKPWR
jgi:hypothetical protein